MIHPNRYKWNLDPFFRMLFFFFPDRSFTCFFNDAQTDIEIFVIRFHCIAPEMFIDFIPGLWRSEIRRRRRGIEPIRRGSLFKPFSRGRINNGSRARDRFYAVEERRIIPGAVPNGEKNKEIQKSISEKNAFPFVSVTQVFEGKDFSAKTFLSVTPSQPGKKYRAFNDWYSSQIKKKKIAK